MLANVDYIFTHESEEDESFMQRLLATRDHLLLTAAEVSTRYNQRRPISRLPPELLYRIFDLVADGFPPRPYDAAADKPGHLGWIVVSHVCQRWRSFLLDMPTMWARCVSVFPCAMKELVSRAQQTPIMISLDTRRVRPPLAPSVFHTALSYIRLGASIKLTLPVAFQETLTYVFTTYDLPATNSLDLEVLRDPLEKSLPSAQLELPRVQAPALRHCVMTNLLLPLAAPALTHLELVRETTKDMGFPTPEAFIGMLARAPQLQTVHIENWIPDCSCLVSNGGALMSLPKLEVLSLTAMPARCESLWRLLRVPQTARLVIDLHRADMHALYALLRALAPHMQRIVPEELCGLSVEEDPDDSFGFRLYELLMKPDAAQLECKIANAASLSPLARGHEERLRLRVANNAQVSSVRWNDELPSLLSALSADAARMRTLAVRSCRTWHPGQWQRVLRQFTRVRVLHVRSLTIDDQPPVELVSALAMDDDTGEGCGAAGPRMVLPSLEELWMRDVVLEERSGRRSPFQERLLKTLRARPLTRLCIARMPTDVDAFPDTARALQESFVACARQLVPVVEWDRANEGRVSAEDWKGRRSWKEASRTF
jgi:hypothetical protein